MISVGRQELIEAAVEGLVRDFEQIDAECGRPCTCGAMFPNGSWRPDRASVGHLPRCLWSAPVGQGVRADF